MSYDSIFSSNVKRKFVRFSERISEGLSRPSFKFISQMLYGILSARSCQLSKIARSLNESASLKKSIERLSRNLGNFNGSAALSENYLGKIKSVVSGKSILIIDDGDITKPCSPKMECISRVRDGSTGEIAQGYETLGVTALTSGQKMPIGVYTRVYSAAEQGFISRDDEVLKALDYLSNHFSKSNIRVFDRGFDANIYYERLIGKGEAFVIRAKKNRDVIYKGKRMNILELASRFKGKYALKYQKKNGQEVDCRITIVPVRLPCRPNAELNLVICHGFGRIPLMLLSNLKSDDARLALVITKVYLLRWRIEEYYAFKKQQFGLEGFRVRALQSIRNLDLLVMIAAGWVGLMSEKCDESLMVMELIRISKRIHGTPRFTFFAIADGLFFLAARAGKGIADLLRIRTKTAQLSFLPDSTFRCAC